MGVVVEFTETTTAATEYNVYEHPYTAVIEFNGVLMIFFFFSSRRRHTRCSRDWSSDVCSSDLLPRLAVRSRRPRVRGDPHEHAAGEIEPRAVAGAVETTRPIGAEIGGRHLEPRPNGRAAWRGKRESARGDRNRERKRKEHTVRT